MPSNSQPISLPNNSTQAPDLSDDDKELLRLAINNLAISGRVSDGAKLKAILERSERLLEWLS